MLRPEQIVKILGGVLRAPEEHAASRAIDQRYWELRNDRANDARYWWQAQAEWLAGVLEQVRAEECERCAKACDEWPWAGSPDWCCGEAWNDACQGIAAAIRALPALAGEPAPEEQPCVLQTQN